MAATIAYDKPVADYIAGLDATGHVTHTKHRKTSVTFHHNAGRLSLKGILDVWKVRPASAHFQVDGAGAVGQYVRIAEYAWATGTTAGNKDSISIEMANATTAPGWTVADVTWTEAARLAGWIFARVIGERPTRSTVKFHKDWKSTTCAGPYMDKVRERLFLAVEAAYNEFTGQGGAAPTPAPTAPAAPSGGKLPVDQIARQVIAGSWGSGDERKRRLAAAGYRYAQVQAEVNRQLSGKPAPAAKTMDQLVNEVLAGDWGNNPGRSQRLQAAGHSPSAVQAAVNARLGGGSSKSVTVRPSNAAIAAEVIAGQWGNGPERRRRIIAAGYDYAAIQAEVNRRLK